MPLAHPAWRLRPDVTLDEAGHARYPTPSRALLEPRPRPSTAGSFLVGRWLFAFGVGLVILASYVWVGQWNLARFDRGIPSLSLWTGLDRRIPLVAGAIWPYLSYYLVALSPTFIATRWSHMVRMGIAYLAATLVATIVWIALPVRMIDVAPSCSGPSCWLLARLLVADGGVNVFPSMHVGHSVLAWLFYRHHGSRWTPWIGAAAGAVTLSTLLTRQHYLLDLPAGAAVGCLGWWVADRVMRSVDTAPDSASRS